MKVVTHRDEHGKRLRLRSYRCEPRNEHPIDLLRRLGIHRKYTHQGEREKSRRLRAAALSRIREFEWQKDWLAA